MAKTTDTADISAAAATLGRMGGRKGGRSTSDAKRAAARANGAKGGRPRNAEIADYIPAKLAPHVTDAYRDSDGIWVALDDAAIDPLTEAHTIHADTIAELREHLRAVRIVEAK